MTAVENTLTGPVAPKPGVGSSYSHGWKHLWKYFGVLLLIGIIYFVISIIPNIPQWVAPVLDLDMSMLMGFTAILGIFSFAYSLLLLSPLGYGMSFAYLKAAREDKVEVGDLFEPFRRNYWNAVLAALLVAVIVVVGFILLIVPGIIFTCKLVFVPYLVVDKKMEVIRAVKTSWRMTNGYAGKVFLMGLLGIPITIAGFICLGVGVIIAGMWITMAFASLYHAVSLEQAAEQPAGI